MSITVLADVILPDHVIAAIGIRGKSMRKNDRVPVASGFQSINILWEQSLREFEFGFKAMHLTLWEKVESVFEVTDGGAYGFLMRDPHYPTVSSGGVVDALTGTNYQLYKRFTNASRTRDRKVTRPIASSFVLMINGTPTLSYTLDATTGIVSIPAAPAEAAVTWTGGVYVPVHFLDDTLDWAMLRSGPIPDDRILGGPTCVLEEILE